MKATGVLAGLAHFLNVFKLGLFPLIFGFGVLLGVSIRALGLLVIAATIFIGSGFSKLEPAATSDLVNYCLTGTLGFLLGWGGHYVVRRWTAPF